MKTLILRCRAAACAALLLAVLPVPRVLALVLGAEELAAARAVTCVLAQDALGYLSEDQFDTLLDGALEDFDETQGDIIYAKALGYVDGLMFGLPEGDERRVNERLRRFNASSACTRRVSDSLRT